ncbi:NAD(P)/FAD-dependent oxidoreductase [Bacillus salitolerans]|uniref:NAD(P)/FAD-dependent oxidoreductase n=1 Tax=Bacillus salitolerans TaxID=1437434 RepID=A0ABW4LUP4_9BACI
MLQTECIIIGGGIAGLQAAIQLGRYKHEIVVIDKGEGRSTLCRCYHNVLGWPDGIDGNQLRQLGKIHAEKYDVQFVKDEIITAKKTNDGFSLQGKESNEYTCKYLLIATGIQDNIPLSLPNLKECLGISIYLCPDCDGYEVMNKRVVVVGAGDVGANMALTLTYWTDQLVYINHGNKEMSQNKLNELLQKKIDVIHENVTSVITSSPSTFSGVQLASGAEIKGERGFLSFGGNVVNTELLKQLGVERLENHHIAPHSRSKETNIENVWVAGDIVAHSEQLTIAMGEGSQAAIWIHKKILQQRDKSIS